MSFLCLYLNIFIVFTQGNCISYFISNLTAFLLPLLHLFSSKYMYQLLFFLFKRHLLLPKQSSTSACLKHDFSLQVDKSKKHVEGLVHFLTIKYTAFWLLSPSYCNSTLFSSTRSQNSCPHPFLSFPLRATTNCHITLRLGR